ncbi:MAG: hypothetical protein Q6370_023415, partial [Candidatus Sigynarchaeota archaeon]
MDTRASTDDGHLVGLADDEKGAMREIERVGDRLKLPIHSPYRFQKHEPGTILKTPVDALLET